jgi:hypothetical protein
MEILLVGLVSCNLDINTSDPQASTCILESKKDNLFISKYEAINVDSSIFKIKQAWAENTWTWEANLLTKQKKTNGLHQVNFIVDDECGKVKNNRYLSNWRMYNKIYGPVSSEGNIFSVDIGDSIIPDTLNVCIELIKNDRTLIPIGKFCLKKTLPPTSPLN